MKVGLELKGQVIVLTQLSLTLQKVMVFMYTLYSP